MSPQWKYPKRTTTVAVQALSRQVSHTYSRTHELPAPTLPMKSSLG